MSKKKSNDGSAVHEILKESGLKIAGWEDVNCGCGLQFSTPIIVHEDTGEPIDLETILAEERR